MLDQNLFVEAVLPGAIQRQLSEEEMDHYRQPFRNPGEDRRPTLSWPRNIPIEGEPADVVAIVEDYGKWLAQSDVPKLLHQRRPRRYRTGTRRATSSDHGPTRPKSPSPVFISSRRTAPTKSARLLPISCGVTGGQLGGAATAAPVCDRSVRA